MNDKEALKKLLLDTELLAKLENNFNNNPNIFSILKVTNYEIRHSNLLAWLLNPKENHNLGSLFLKKFINVFVKEYARAEDCIDLLLTDYDDFKIEREWKNIDLLLTSKKNKIVIAIENKINSKEHDNQLKRYYSIIKDSFKDYKAYFIFLTLDGSEPQNMKDIWQVMDYKSIAEILDNIESTHSLNNTVKLIINNYKEAIRSLINMENPEIKELCMQIYDKHKKAIDLIIENIPSENPFLADLSTWITNDWSKKYNFKNISNHKWFEFFSNTMDELLPNLNGNLPYKYFFSVVTNTHPWYCKISFELQYNGLFNNLNYELAKLIDKEINNRNLEERGKNNSGKWNVYGFKNWQINIDEDNYELESENIKKEFQRILFEEIPELERKIKEIKNNMN